MMYLILLIVATTVAVNAQNTYVVLSPSKVRSNMNFTMSVNILKSTADVVLTATILKGETVVVTGQGTFKAGVPSTLSLQVPAGLTSAVYTLKVVGSGGLNFTNTTTLDYNSKELSLFIQSDKAIYKPGDTINFRTFGIYPDMKMYTGLVDISIYDAASNKIKQWDKQTSNDGVVTLQVILSSQPVLGDWKIQVETETTKTEKVVTITEYVLPKFEVTVIMPPYTLTTDNDITCTVKAEYTYGKSVVGTAVLKLKFLYSYYGNDYSKAQEISTVTAQVNGEAKVSIPLSEVKKITNSLDGHILIVTTNVTESLTGNIMSGNGTVKIYDKPTVLEFPKINPNNFKPGLQYKAYLKISQPDGKPVMATNQKVKVTTSVVIELPKQVSNPSQSVKRIAFPPSNTETKQLPEQHFDVPEDGMVAIPVDIPKKAKSATIQAEFQGVSTSLYLSQTHSPSESYIQLMLENTANVHAGDEIKFKVKSTEAIQNLVYQVLSRGVLVKAGIIDVANKVEHAFTIKSDSSMAPNARCVVYYVRADGEIVTDSLSLDISGAFQNKVAISFNTTEVEPGNNVKVTVSADPNSVLYMMAIDQSVLLLKSGNDVTQNDVHSDLKKYDTVDDEGGIFPRPMFDCPMCKRKKRSIWWPRFYGGNDAAQVFENSGVKVITDASVYRYIERFHPIPLFLNAVPLAGGGMLANMNAKTDGMPIPEQTVDNNLMEPTRVRLVFSETWLWKNVTMGGSGKHDFDSIPPDTITSWVASAFATNSLSGLGIAETPAKLRVFRQFFVSLNLPYSVTRGEQLALQAIVFNYMQEDMEVRVTLAQSKSFSNIVIIQKGKEELRQEETSQRVLVKAGEAKSVFFPIVPTVIGKIDIEIKAQSKIAADAVRRQLLVEAEGVQNKYNVPMLIDLTGGKKSFSLSANLSLPANVVKDSEHFIMAVVGDLMGSTLSGIENLLQMPYGCGEQNMLVLGPNVYIMNYLTAVNKLSGDIKAKSINFMESGYQRELTYKHKDGSYSAFGESDKSGSTWLTAFVNRVFHEAKEHIYIDINVIIASLRWLIEQQNSNGSFNEPGVVIHKSMQGNAASGASLTAFVLICLLENRDLLNSTGPSGEQAIGKAVAYLEAEIAISDDLYFLAISSYALELAGSTQSKLVMDKLNKKATVKDGLKYFHKEETAKPATDLWENPNPTKAVDTEITSYVALTLIKQGDIAGVKSLIQWIIKQRNPNGGFQSTQDTIVALLALSRFAKQIYSNNFNIDVTITLSDTQSYNFHVDQNNALIYQIQEASIVPSKVKVDATGTGIALVDLSVFFNVQREIEKESFELTVMLLEEDINFLVLEACTKWLGEGASTAMAVMEIGSPSGFEFDLDSVSKVDTLKRKEVQNKQLILYFDEIGTNQTCVKAKMTRTGLVAKSQPVPVKVFDYYEPGNQKIVFYQSKILESTEICDVCKGCENCV